MDIRQIANEARYDLVASYYEYAVFLLSLGQAPRLYDEVASKLDLPPGGTVVELGCGPGCVVPSILKRHGKSLSIIGIDFSRRMIEVANHRKKTEDWANVRFECMDMYRFSTAKKIDSVVFCLALTAMPNYRKALEKAISMLKPGGQLLIIDSIPRSTKWYHPLSNAYLHLKSIIVGAKPVGAILDFINKKTKPVEIREMAFGIYTLIDARIA